MAQKLPRYTNEVIRALIDDRIHSRRDRMILYLKLVDGLSFTEIEDETGIPASTVTDAYYKQVKELFYDFPG